MSVLTVRFTSEALAKQTSFNVIHPDEGEGPFPVLMQLHGYSDDSFSWLYNSNLVRHAGEYPLIVVLPDGGTARYLNLPVHDRYGPQRYEDLVMRDIPAQVERMFHLRPGSWAIGGLSMGGYGALRLGMKHPEMFASIWAHSSAFHIDHLVDPALVQDAADADVLVHAEQIARRADLPTIAFDCGVDDEGLIDHNRALHARMDALEIPHHYAEHPGGHTWDYWDEHVREALAQHARVLGLVGVG